MKVLWTTSIKVGKNITVIEKDNPNIVMDFAAALYLHRLEQPADGTSIYEKIKYVALGTDDTDASITNKEILANEFARENVTSSFRYEDNGNIIVIDYSYENVSGATIEVLERGVISGGVDFDNITDWSDRSLTGYLVSRQTDEPISLPNNGVMYGTIRIFLNI